MPNFKWYANSSSQYDFGFNGQEQDDEVSGDGNTNTAEFWEYDSRLARRWNIDPVTKANLSPYECLGSTPLQLSDPRGNDPDGWLKTAKGYTHWTNQGGDDYDWIYEGIELPDKSVTPRQRFVNGHLAYNLLSIHSVKIETRYHSGPWVGDNNYAEPGLRIRNHGMAGGGINQSDIIFDVLSLGIDKGLKTAANLASSLVSKQLAKKGAITLYRSVFKEELKDIASHGIRNGEGYETVKLFAKNPQDAANWGRLNYGFEKTPFTIIKTTIPNKFKSSLLETEMDLMPAVSVPKELLPHLSEPIKLNFTPLPMHAFLK